MSIACRSLAQCVGREQIGRREKRAAIYRGRRRATWAGWSERGMRRCVGCKADPREAHERRWQPMDLRGLDRTRSMRHEWDMGEGVMEEEKALVFGRVFMIAWFRGDDERNYRNNIISVFISKRLIDAI